MVGNTNQMRKSLWLWDEDYGARDFKAKFGGITFCVPTNDRLGKSNVFSLHCQI